MLNLSGAASSWESLAILIIQKDGLVKINFTSAENNNTLTHNHSINQLSERRMNLVINVVYSLFMNCVQHLL